MGRVGARPRPSRASASLRERGDAPSGDAPSGDETSVAGVGVHDRSFEPGCGADQLSLGPVCERNRARGEPELAVLVVRKSDRLPGEGFFHSL